MDDPRQPRAVTQDRSPLAIAVAGFYVLLFVALVWPIYPLFATIEPRVLAMPFSLFYVVVCLLLSFFALFAFYLWERKRDAAETGAPAAGDAGAAGGGHG
ncbi:hypothetical protein [Candidatus Palauibacter sp.]|uniref:hypothetical protein n=1 Tax=Candidatus Palauibacter sp. TaxID=3101350 RepID=UPI003B02E68F